MNDKLKEATISHALLDFSGFVITMLENNNCSKAMLEILVRQQAKLLRIELDKIKV